MLASHLTEIARILATAIVRIDKDDRENNLESEQSAHKGLDFDAQQSVTVSSLNLEHKNGEQLL